MKTNTSFDVDFNYALSENLIVCLTANVNLRHSLPHYFVTNFHFKNNPDGRAALPDISLVAIKKDDEINWLHLDSHKETLLSMAVGKAIEEKVNVEFLNVNSKGG